MMLQRGQIFTQIEKQCRWWAHNPSTARSIQSKRKNYENRKWKCAAGVGKYFLYIFYESLEIAFSCSLAVLEGEVSFGKSQLSRRYAFTQVTMTTKSLKCYKKVTNWEFKSFKELSKSSLEPKAYWNSWTNESVEWIYQETSKLSFVA